VVGAWGAAISASFPMGSRIPLDKGGVVATVIREERPARIDDYAATGSVVARGEHERSVRSAVGCPIVVGGITWGAIVLATSGDMPCPPRTEARIAEFADLVATAIANTRARGEVERLAEEQAALRRVATLVAQGVPPGQIFAAVSDEVGRLLGTERAAVDRFEYDGPAILVVGARGGMQKSFPTGSRWEMDELFASTKVFHTGRAARMELKDSPSASGPIADLLRREQVASTVACPIVVDGRLWGAVTVSTTDGLLPLDTEERLRKFTELVATAIANAESGEAVRRLADEQAALGRVATRVAQGVPPREIFAAVSEEVGHLIGSDTAAVVRFEHHPPAIVVVGVGGSIPGIPIGTRSELDDALASTQVYRTGRPARVDERNWASFTGPLAEPGRCLTLSSTVASPIHVEGRVWGTISVSAKGPLPLGTEERLEKWSELVATAIANAESREALARLANELAASRRRIVTASDETRRRIERDLHDGIQQRLVSLGLEVRAAQVAVSPQHGELEGALSAVSEGLACVCNELREISRGIHPAILAEGGLKPALRVLSRRSAVPVQLDLLIERRLPERVEVAAYYVVSEALTNAAKHAHASVVNVELDTHDSILQLAICDDGIGGADASQGSGLVGLSDRIEALGGTLEVTSPPAGGTTLLIEIPLYDQSTGGGGVTALR
jgi:signal transduction histidine kinase